MNAIERAAEAVVKHILGDDIPDDEWTCCAAIIRAKLAEAVPAKDYLQPHSEICQCGDCGWNECRKAFLGEAE